MLAQPAHRARSAGGPISNLASLQILNLAGNPIRSLPDGISALPELVDVRMLDGQPEHIPIDNLECEWDVFISHASEDKSGLVEPLAALLERAGIRVWLDAWELRVGDGIRQSIDEGLRRSRFGLLLLSPAYMNRYWTTGEFEALTALEAAKKLYLLPVWHAVTQEDVLRFSPLLAGRKAADTKDGIESVATVVADAIFY